MPAHKFRLERMPTAIGTMLILTDEQDRLRALDWEDHAARMHRLLRLHYRADRASLLEGGSPTRACRSLEAYFAGDLAAIDGIPVETGGTTSQREVRSALRPIAAGPTM